MKYLYVVLALLVIGLALIGATQAAPPEHVLMHHFLGNGECQEAYLPAQVADNPEWTLGACPEAPEEPETPEKPGEDPECEFGPVQMVAPALVIDACPVQPADEITSIVEDQPQPAGVLWLLSYMEVVNVRVFSVDGWEADVAVWDSTRFGEFNAVFAPDAPLGDYVVYVNGVHVASFTLFTVTDPAAVVTWYDDTLVYREPLYPSWAFVS